MSTKNGFHAKTQSRRERQGLFQVLKAVSFFLCAFAALRLRSGQALRETFPSDSEKRREVECVLPDMAQDAAHVKSQDADGQEDDAQKTI
jgi:hypothetical protein